MSIPRQLLTYLNSGKCFALIGSGLSTALEYPSWKQMAVDATKLLPTSDPEQKALSECIDKWDYPEVFERVASRIGIAHLLAALKKTFSPKRTNGIAYEIVSRWPFRCYLTTNYDDEILKHLKRIGQHFTVLTNSQADLAPIKADSQRRIVKLHGDLNSPGGIVLTTGQYSEFEIVGNRQYFRSKMVSIFQMVPVVVFGHSMADRDFQLILRLAKESATPENPIYMIVADASQTESDKLLREFNIKIISYSNTDRTHKNLTQLLRQIDRFVVPRTANTTPPLDFPDAEDAAKAVSLYVHSALGFGGNNKLVQRTIQPQILSLAASSNGGVEITSIAKTLKPESLRKLQSIDSEIDMAVEHLTDTGNAVTNGIQLTATIAGKQHLAETKGKSIAEEDQFYGAIRQRLLSYGSPRDVDVLIAGLKTALVTVFRKRGLAAAEFLFRSSPFEAADMPELFDAVFPPAATLNDFTLRAEYCNAVMDVLTSPNDDQKNYLAHLAQGFFAYHMFGIDPSGQEIRKKLAQGTLWLLDSNILMPLVARHSVQHHFIDNLVATFRKLGIRAVTTQMLISEVDRALGWMQNQLKDVLDGEERHALLRVTQRPDYSENPFVDAFIEGHVAGQWRSMSEFLKAIGHEARAGMRIAIQSYGIEVIASKDVDPSGESIIDELSEEIQIERVRVGTDRAGEIQAKAEGESLHILRQVRRNGFRGDASLNRAFFVSTSRLLDNLYRKTDGLITWYPETLHNHLAYISGDVIDAETIFRGITASFYSAGISVVDESAYRHYFKPAISEATATLSREMENYIKATDRSVTDQQSERESIVKAFRRTPDNEKPLFVEQMGWTAARRAEENLKAAVRQRDETENRLKAQVSSLKAEYERKERERKRHDEGRQRNLNDPKHLRKRLRQAKKKNKKNN